MLKAAIIVLILIGLFAAKALIKGWKNRTRKETEKLERLRDLVPQLMASKNKSSFLRISPDGHKEFFQITSENKRVQINFPLISEGQVALREIIEQAANRRNIPIHETTGSDGSKFLDIDIEENPDQVTNVLYYFMGEAFQTNIDDDVHFEYWGM